MENCCSYLAIGQFRSCSVEGKFEAQVSVGTDSAPVSKSNPVHRGISKSQQEYVNHGGELGGQRCSCHWLSSPLSKQEKMIAKGPPREAESWVLRVHLYSLEWLKRQPIQQASYFPPAEDPFNEMALNWRSGTWILTHVIPRRVLRDEALINIPAEEETKSFEAITRHLNFYSVYTSEALNQYFEPSSLQLDKDQGLVPWQLSIVSSEQSLQSHFLFQPPSWAIP